MGQRGLQRQTVQRQQGPWPQRDAGSISLSALGLHLQRRQQAYEICS